MSSASISMDTVSLRFKGEIIFGNYSVLLGADDERVIEAVTGWIDEDIAACHQKGGEVKRTAMELQFYSNIEQRDISDPVRGEPTATFEDIEFYSGDDSTSLVIDGQTALDIDLRNNSARCLISREHMESPWILSHRVFYLPILEILRNIGAYYVHTGCLCMDDRCILLCGGSGHGKSTTTYSLARSGFSFMSDDAVFVQGRDGELEIFSFPEKIKLDAKSCSFFPELSNCQVPRGKAEIPLSDTGIKHVSVTGKPHALILLERGENEKGEIVPISRSEALLGLIRQSISLTIPSSIEPHLDILKQLCESSHTYRLKLGKDVSEAPRLVEDALNEV
ncbi:MAG: hypothetical protein ABFR50_10950 [Candidatus Fermentibacteria bacterium]